jgi:hypothetical protein
MHPILRTCGRTKPARKRVGAQRGRPHVMRQRKHPGQVASRLLALARMLTTRRLLALARMLTTPRLSALARVPKFHWTRVPATLPRQTNSRTCARLTMALKGHASGGWTATTVLPTTLTETTRRRSSAPGPSEALSSASERWSSAGVSRSKQPALVPKQLALVSKQERPSLAEGAAEEAAAARERTQSGRLHRARCVESSSCRRAHRGLRAPATT